MAENDFDKTEPATARRREEARQEGNVARSADLTAACMLLAAIMLLHLLGLKVFRGLQVTLQAMLRTDFAANPTRPDDLAAMIAYGLRMGAEIVAPLLLCITAVGLVATISQVGFRVTPNLIMPNFSRLNPLRGLSGIFDMRGRIRLLTALGKVGVVFGVAVWFVLGDLPRIVTLGELEALSAFGSACEIIYALALKLALLLVVLALVDYIYQYWQRERDLRMAKSEVKEELRRMEGDPLVKQRRVRVARQMALQRVGAAVPKADVIVTNPTHFAVALRYDSKAMKAPKVVAKGADFLALRIRQLAALHGVPIIERRELAQTLYKSVAVGQEVPPQFYSAVAEVLAYVFRLSGRKIA